MKQEFITRKHGVFEGEQINKHQRIIDANNALEKKILGDTKNSDIYESDSFSDFLKSITNEVFIPINNRTAENKMIVREIMELFSSVCQNTERTVLKDQDDFEARLKNLQECLTQDNQLEVQRNTSKFDSESDKLVEKINNEDDEKKKKLLREKLGELLINSDNGSYVQEVYHHKIDQAVLVDALKNRAKQMDEKQEKLAEIIEEEKKYFVKIIEDTVRKGELPETALASIGEIARLDVIVFDGLISLNYRYQGMCEDSNNVKISSFMMQPRYKQVLRHTLRHEFLHAINGEIINEYLDDRGNSEGVVFIKKGLKLRSPNKESSRGYGRWLDEGAIELLNIKLFGDIDIDEEEAIFLRAYLQEMSMIKGFLNRGLDERLLWEAMFEVHQIKPSKGIGNKMVELIGEINRVSNIGSFAKIDNEDYMQLVIIPALISVYVYDVEIAKTFSDKKDQQRIEFDVILGKGKNRASKRFVYYNKNNDFAFHLLIYSLKKELGTKIENIKEFNV